MIFSSMTFLWLFLPVVFGLYYLMPQRCRNIILLIASLLFYSWGEPVYIFLMIFSILINYVLALLIDRYRDWSKAVLVMVVLINIGLLWYFKYYLTFAQLVDKYSHRNLLPIRDIALPIGISFYTFQILSYVIDVYRKECEVQKNVLDFALYVSFFPQLVAGPIVKYRDISHQIRARVISSDKVAQGMRRFIYGLSKKALIANNIAAAADSIYSSGIHNVGAGWLWVGACLYTLQIYYDFSGYSDMAIGLGKMFGFDFAENFNYPYVSQSIREFWRRWHISLSSWFKEYVYIPLGGNRKGKLRTYINLAIVFVITGIWHGASLNFLLWGCYHGFFILIERMGLGKLLSRNRFGVVNRIYTMLVVIVGWAIFRCDTLGDALHLVQSMLGFKSGHLTYLWYDFFSIKTIVVVAAAVLLSGFVQDKNDKIRSFLYDSGRIRAWEVILQGMLTVMCILSLIGGQYNPFIYFKF